MKQVTRRGLVQASLFSAVLAAAVMPRDLGMGLQLNPIVDPDWQAKLRLSKYISQTFKCSFDLAQRIVQSAYVNASSAGLPPLLVLAVVAKESSFSPDARSHYGAVGLMQVVPRIHAQAVADISHPAGLRHPESNIATGTRILKGYLKGAGGNIRKALTRYSGGARKYPELVTRYWARFATVAYNDKPMA